MITEFNNSTVILCLTFVRPIATLSVAKQLCLGAIPSLNDNKQAELSITVGILMVLAGLAVVLRLYCRRISRMKLGADDYLILLSLVRNEREDFSWNAVVHNGIDPHVWLEHRLLLLYVKMFGMYARESLTLLL